mmetsp:Transcript_6754/g.12168  ORF Transcript_6754/g.12168 Transcript_6754/m.12168 type:complete len:99 (-) Transcript_6754:116-412(-)
MTSVIVSAPPRALLHPVWTLVCQQKYPQSVDFFSSKQHEGSTSSRSHNTTKPIQARPGVEQNRQVSCSEKNSVSVQRRYDDQRVSQSLLVVSQIPSIE